ncbi:hypothetical protein WISP_150130 [Willisornis vidua]|uniref:Uncharacterized protein n=1 Tax=Willisornis vidua TaxID=1566151 RepID=A0ABQ9CJT2_9PASS|nr:hypothetical protein WISP_150130 [Willisornis vidua]
MDSEQLIRKQPLTVELQPPENFSYGEGQPLREEDKNMVLLRQKCIPDKKLKNINVVNLLKVLKRPKKLPDFKGCRFLRNGGTALLESQGISILESQSIFGCTKKMKGSGNSDWSLWHLGESSPRGRQRELDTVPKLLSYGNPDSQEQSLAMDLLCQEQLIASPGAHILCHCLWHQGRPEKRINSLSTPQFPHR